MQDKPHDKNGEAKAQEPGRWPVPSSLANTFESGTEQAIYESGTVMIIVQGYPGGCYELQIAGKDQNINKRFDELEQVETYLAEQTTYTKHSPVWVPLPVYLSWATKLASLKRSFEREELR